MLTYGAPQLQNQFDSIDLTDNAITRLEGFPRLHRLRTLLLSNNRINRISPRLEGKQCCRRACLHERACLFVKRCRHALCCTLVTLMCGWHNPEQVPNLEWLILSNNRMNNLQVPILNSAQNAYVRNTRVNCGARDAW